MKKYILRVLLAEMRFVRFAMVGWFEKGCRINIETETVINRKKV